MNRRMLLTLWTACLLLAGAMAWADDTTITPKANLADVSAPPAAKGCWVNISEPTIKKLQSEGKKICSGGAGVGGNGETGGTAGVMVDRTNGDVYIIVLANGLWKSKDKGAVFERIDGGKVAYTPNGGEGNPAGLDADPDGNRFMCFMMHGTGALVLDSGATVVKCPINSTDCGATDWSDGKTMIAVYHEQNGKAGISLDGGATWTNIGAGFEGVGVFDAKTFVATKTKEPGISRSQDGGLTWAKVSDLMPTGEAMRVFKGVGYFTSKKGLLVSKDKGATWAVQGKPIECKVGPLFGKNEKHLVVGTNEGLMETTDGGQTWNLAAPIPDWPEWTVPPYLAIKHSFKCVRWGGTVFCPSIYAWDPQNDVFYASTYSGPVLKYQR